MTAEPVWLSREEIEYLHAQSLRDFGGSAGLRDEGLIESGRMPPVNTWSYNPEADPALLGAAYAFGLAKNHGFIDGNKRIGFLAMATFLYVNGWMLDADEAEAVAVMLMLASGEMDEVALAEWVRGNLRPRVT